MIETEFIDANYGQMIIDLKPLLKEKKITPYRLSKLTGIKFDTIYRYCNNKIYRIDLTNLARICTVLHCDSSDIIKYVKIQH